MMCKMCAPLTAAAPFQQNGSAPKKEPLRGRTVARCMSGRVTGVVRETSKARNAGRCLWAALLYSAPAQRRINASATRWLRRTRQNAERRRRDTGGRKGYRVIRRGYPSIRRTETEVDLRMRGWGWILIRPAAIQTRIRPVSGRRQMRTSRITQEK